MNPKNQVLKTGAIKRIVMQVNSLPRARSYRDGLCPTMRRRTIGQIHCCPAPILPAIDQRIIENHLISLRPDRPDQNRQTNQYIANHANLQINATPNAIIRQPSSMKHTNYYSATERTRVAILG